MPVTRPNFQNRVAVSLIAIPVVALALYLLYAFEPSISSRFAPGTGEMRHSAYELVFNLIKLALWFALAYSVVRIIAELIFGTLYRRRQGQDAPALARNIFSLVANILLFVFIFKSIFVNVSLGAVFTGSAVVGVILGLALQDTLGNLFSGISLHADKPFQVGDVITVGQLTGVVEGVTWRAVKIRTFSNHVVLISNSATAKESIQVCPRNNLNARIVFFNAVYSASPIKVIHIVREAVREAENVTRKIAPVVRIRALGDSSVDYEVKYWLEDYARYNDTDALVRQRIWYAFRRAGISFAYPTRRMIFERKRADGATRGDSSDLIDRLSAVDIFAPLTADELTRLAANCQNRVFAPGESIIRAGDTGSSMFVVHRGRVEVKTNDNGRSGRTVAILNEGDFFGEMALFTGEPRTANVLATEETEVLEVVHGAMKSLFDANPDLVESLSHIIAERRAGLAAQSLETRQTEVSSDGILASIKRFFRMD